MASASEAELRDRISQASGQDASWLSIGVIDDQITSIRHEVAKARAHPLIPSSVAVGGFLYDVDTGLLHQVC
jgi:carbonic anhydrase